uniref:Uncharacterized protein n=1 Tax=Aegilops tauschii subsp. strangulata TaxID=200361 RepID=A0A452ZD24_AEGTS
MMQFDLVKNKSVLFRLTSRLLLYTSMCIYGCLSHMRSRDAMPILHLRTSQMGIRTLVVVAAYLAKSGCLAVLAASPSSIHRSYRRRFQHMHDQLMHTKLATSSWEDVRLS